MIHFPRNNTIFIPISVALFDADGAARTGETGTTTVRVLCLDNGNVLDSDGSFKSNPTSPNLATTAFATPFDNLYQHRFDVSEWPRGHFLATFSAAGGQVYNEDFTVGLVADRRLEYSAAYSGTVLTVSAWIEENGQVQPDYTGLVNCKILDSAGTQITDLGSNTAPIAGVFKFTATTTLAIGKNYIFDCIAQVLAPAGVNAYQFPLRFGFQRP